MSPIKRPVAWNLSAEFYLQASLLRRTYLFSSISVVLLAIGIWIAEPSAFFDRFRNVSIATITFACLFLTLNLLGTIVRFWAILREIRSPVSWPLAFKACMAANIASLVVVPIFGQIAGRQLVLNSAGISSFTTTSIFVLERLLVAGVSGTLAISGAIYLWGNELLDKFSAYFDLLMIAPIAIGGYLISYAFCAGSFEKRLFKLLLSKRSAFALARSIAITVLSQLAITVAIVICLHSIAPQLPLLVLFSAACIISFAASMPISVGGWGVREIATIYVLGEFGVSAADALTASVVIGLCSTFVIIGVAMIGVGIYKDLNAPLEPKIANSLAQPDTPFPISNNVERACAWFLILATAIALFFNAHVPIGNGSSANFNLADPFAILLALTVLLLAFINKKLPTWYVPRWNLMILALSVVMVGGFINGWIHIGITAWALNIKLVGWAILLSYLYAGCLVSKYFGAPGVRRVIETMACVACVIVVYDASALFITSSAHTDELKFELRGFAANRNAFAFQLVIVLGAYLGYLQVFAKRWHGSKPMHRLIEYLPILVMSLGILGTASRTGIVSAIAVLALGFFLSYKHENGIGFRLMTAALIAFVLISSVNPVFSDSPFKLARESPRSSSVLGQSDRLATIRPAHLDSTELESKTSCARIRLAYSPTESDELRKLIISTAVKLWRESPIWGIGMGGFYARSSEFFGRPIVIHSTPLWLLTEFGVVGTSIFGIAFANLVFHGLRKSRSDPRAASLLLLLLGFGLFCQFHEMLYQRILWFMLGVLLSKPFGVNGANSGMSDKRSDGTRS